MTYFGSKILIFSFFFFLLVKLINTQGIREGTYSIYSKLGPSLAIQGSLPLESGGGMEDGARLITTTDLSAVNNFEIKYDFDEIYYIFAKHSMKPIDEDMEAHYTQNWNFLGNAHQMWSFIRMANGLYLIQGFESKRFLVAPQNTGDMVMTAVIDGDLSNADKSFYWVLDFLEPVPKNYCLTLMSMSIGSVGDLDRQNEELEFEITISEDYKGYTQINCGLFLLDFVKNTKDKNLMITIPCKEDEYVKVRCLERDNCNDDTSLLPIECTPTVGSVMKEVIIKPDSTSHSSCQHFSNQVQLCLSRGAKLGPSTKKVTTSANISACYAYQWGKEECATGEDVAEIESRYYLQFKVDSAACDWQWKGLNKSNNEVCQFHQYYPSPSCDMNNTL